MGDFYNEKFERCKIGLLAYTANFLSTAIEHLNENREPIFRIFQHF